MSNNKVKPLTKAENKLYLQLQERLYATTPVNCSAPIPLEEAVQVSSVQATLNERGNRYGDFTDHAQVAQDLQDLMRTSFKAFDDNDNVLYGWEFLNPVQRQALTVLADKIAQILVGDPNYADNWHDIQGYAKLVEDRLPCNQHG